MPDLNLQDIGIIILAAGSSQRFAGDKRQALLGDGRSLLESTLSQVPASFKRRLLVLHNKDELLTQQYSEQWDICIAEDSRLGMGHSLAAAIAKLDSKWQGALIGLGDMPFIKPETYSGIQQALCQQAIVIPMFQGRRGNPVGFQAKYFAELACLRGDQGARNLLSQQHAVCYQYETNDEGIVRDIDRREQIE